MDKVKEELKRICSTALMSIDGLKEIQEAEKDMAEWGREEFEFGIAGESKHLRPKPEHDVRQMKLKHPRAAAYLNTLEIVMNVGILYSSFMDESLKTINSIINDDDYHSDLDDLKEDLEILICGTQSELQKMNT